MDAKGVFRKGQPPKGLTNIGQINYTTQYKTNVFRSPQNGELIVAPNYPYKRRFVM